MLTDRIHLEDDERVLLTTRKHWFVLLSMLFVPALALALPFIAPFFLPHFPIVLELTAALPHPTALITFAGAAWFLLFWILLFLAWTDYYLDLWLITTRRIIAIEQRGLFRRSVASFRYERLQDIAVDINGIIATLLDFGDLAAKTAGHSDEFRVQGIPDPRRVKARITAAADALLLGTGRAASLSGTDAPEVRGQETRENDERDRADGRE